ncbi:redoxin domain-containing protein [Sphingobacterium sp.]|uniref:redoxin domain-containing protein n=1 Tax=Sphingobacterium sp. TaxID=341027 RepID=UPI0031DDDB27
MRNLEYEIAKLNANLANLPLEIKEIFGRSIQDLQSEDLTEKSLQVGDKFPDISLVNSQHKEIELEKLLKKGKVIVTFFSGSWCPYYDLELRALQEKLSYFKENGVSLLAISPQMPRYNDQLRGDLALLPVPAVFVIERDYTISYRFMDDNYMNRLNVVELIAQL